MSLAGVGIDMTVSLAEIHLAPSGPKLESWCMDIHDGDALVISRRSGRSTRFQDVAM